MSHLSNILPFKEKNQSFWQSGLILGSGLGLVSMMVGGQISKTYGAGIAITSILLGNFILWFIGLGIISMTSERAHAIQNIKDSLGKFPATIAAIIIVAAFLVWYALQIKIPTDSLMLLINHKNMGDNLELRVSAGLGFSCALIGMGGIKTIKWLNIISFPLIFLFLTFMLFRFGQIDSFKNSWGVSSYGILLIVLAWFPGTVNLSTFFRHSRSRADSFLGLTIMTISHMALQTFSVILDITNPIDILTKNNLSVANFDFFIVLCFVLISYFCVNLLNIYWASVGWEVFFMNKQEIKGYAIIGLLGTVIYIFFQSTTLIAIIEILGTSFIANLGITLIASYITKIVVQHRVRKIDKFSNSICWLAGCVSSIILLFFRANDIPMLVLIGINASLISFGIIIFFEEIAWSIKHLRSQ